jgi:predicted RNA-binding Zn-ribbon protein involved in translation (DUF1610 family)
MFFKTHICENCGANIKPRKKHKGSVLVFLVLCLFLIVPGLIYAAWALSSGYLVCPQCGSKEIIPLNTPRGKKLKAQFQ